ncbi:hypothetical protein [Streptomyces sp. NPDC018693]|uniref:hypothetical protein n=1 Tax=unclassified Streptomyces TaxID=2593676 RepID=UPI003793C94D
MIAPAHPPLPRHSKRPADLPAQRAADLPAQRAAAAEYTEEPQPCAFSAERSCAEPPLTSEPPLPDAEPLTSEPPLAADAHTTRP